MDNELRFFVSFSSRDLKYAREIMAALKGQDLDFWNYADIAQSIELGEKIDERLISEIDRCTHMIVVISYNSMDPQIGRFCWEEMNYARQKAGGGSFNLIPVLLDQKDKFRLEYPYDYFEEEYCQELNDTPESIVALTVKICKLIKKVYVPPIEAHPNLPFWKFFRKEIEDFAQTNKDHIDLMMILGEFNEYYRKSGLERAMFLISYFIQACHYKIPGYQLFYPLIVQAVCETELGKFDDALISYEQARMMEPANQDAIGGLGTVYFKKGEFKKAAECFETILQNPGDEDVTNARINLVICKLAMGKSILATEKDFLYSVDISGYSSDLKTAILNARGICLLGESKYNALEQLCSRVIAEELHDSITCRLLQLSFLNRGMKEKARETIEKAIRESKLNPRLNREVLGGYL